MNLPENDKTLPAEIVAEGAQLESKPISPNISDYERKKSIDSSFTFVLLALLFLVEVCLFPVAVFVLFLCLLEMLVKHQHKNRKQIKGDKNVYRTSIRPIARYLTLAPVAVVGTLVLLLAASAMLYILPIAFVVMPILCIVITSRESSRQIVEADQNTKQTDFVTGLGILP